jgi:hypothetical protein
MSYPPKSEAYMTTVASAQALLTAYENSISHALGCCPFKHGQMGLKAQLSNASMS